MLNWPSGFPEAFPFLGCALVLRYQSLECSVNADGKMPSLVLLQHDHVQLVALQLLLRQQFQFQFQQLLYRVRTRIKLHLDLFRARRAADGARVGHLVVLAPAACKGREDDEKNGGRRRRRTRRRWWRSRNRNGAEMELDREMYEKVCKGRGAV